MAIKRCLADAHFEMNAQDLQTIIHAELGHKRQYHAGDFPVDWAAVEVAAKNLAAIAKRAKEHGKRCEQCQRDTEHGYVEES